MFNNKWKNSLSTLFDSRETLSKNDFIERVRAKNYNISYTEIVYDNILNYLPKSISENIYPEDDLINDYGIDEDDLGDIMIEVFKKLNLEFPSLELQQQFYTNEGDKITVEKMINFVSHFGN